MWYLLSLYQNLNTENSTFYVNVRCFTKKNTNHKIDLYLLLNFWDGPSQGDSTQPTPPPPTQNSHLTNRCFYLHKESVIAWTSL